MSQDRDVHGDGMVDWSCSRALMVDLIQDPNQQIFAMPSPQLCPHLQTARLDEDTRPRTSSVLASVWNRLVPLVLRHDALQVLIGKKAWVTGRPKNFRRNCDKNVCPKDGLLCHGFQVSIGFNCRVCHKLKALHGSWCTFFPSWTQDNGQNVFLQRRKLRSIIRKAIQKADSKYSALIILL